MTGQVFTSRLKILSTNTAGDVVECVSAAYYGEIVDMYSNNGEYALIRHKDDHYVGWVPMKGLGELGPPATHRISVPMAYGFSEPDLKSAPQTTLFQNSRVVAEGKEGKFVKCGPVGWIPDVHLAPVDVFGSDPVRVAAGFTGAPYIWGGRDMTGVDCSGLTQMAFAACGLQLPRDSDMQFGWCGDEIEHWDQPGNLQRNDLVFWKGHVGIMLDEQTLLHANAYHMLTIAEPLADAISRIAQTYGPPIGARRIALDGSNCQNWRGD